MTLRTILRCWWLPGVLCAPLLFGANGDPAMNGVWKLDPKTSSDIVPWRSMRLEIHQDGSMLTLVHVWQAGRRESQRDSITVTTDGKTNTIALKPGKWPENVHLGVYGGHDARREVVATWEDDGKTLRLRSQYSLETSQGSHRVTVERSYRVSADGSTLTVEEMRSTRQTGPPLVFVYKKSEPEAKGSTP
jgi:hypothetical protein